MDEDFVIKYDYLNKSFKKKLVFNVGSEQGFFSEINNMIFMMLYCLDKKIKFTLFSDKANFANDKGWAEFFEPFCPENHLEKNIKYNKRCLSGSLSRKIIKFWKKKIVFWLWKKNNGIDYLTFELWDSFFCNSNFTNKIFSIDQLRLYGNSFKASKQLAEMIWRFNAETKVAIEECMKKANLPEYYVSIHIRGGDKILEKSFQGDLLEIDSYVEKLEQKIGEIKNIFIFTDEYRHVERLSELRPQWNVFTLCGNEERGYFHNDFQKTSWEIKKNGILKLFANIEIIRASQYFLGTKTANPDWFLAMIMPKEKFCCIQCDEIDWN